MDPASWKLTGEEALIPTTHEVDACSCNLTGEESFGYIMCHLLHLDSPSISSEPQENSSAESVEIECIDESEEAMNMISSCSTKRLIPHLTISTFRTLMSVKMKMSSSSMPPN